MNLAKMNKSIDWMAKWRSVAERYLSQPEVYQHGSEDQAIFNAVFYDDPKLVTELPCDWNYQVKREAKCGNDNNSFALHFNHHDKTEFLLKPHVSALAKYTKKIYNYYVGKDGYSLRNDSKLNDKHHSPNNRETVKKEGGNACSKYNSLEQSYRVFPFFYSSTIEPVDISEPVLVTYFKFDQVPSKLTSLCQRWDGNISIAIYLEDKDIVQMIQIRKRSTCLSSGKINLHLVFQLDGVDPNLFLLETALKYAGASSVFILENNYWPSGNAHSLLADSMFEKQENSIVIVPTFEISQNRFFSSLQTIEFRRHLLLFFSD